jgi:hypothetical protein
LHKFGSAKICFETRSRFASGFQRANPSAKGLSQKGKGVGYFPNAFLTNQISLSLPQYFF